MPSPAKRNLEFDMAARGRARRLELGLTQLQLGTRMGFCDKRVSLLEQDGAATLRIVRVWAKALDMCPARLAFGVGATDV
jgi:transcriptional regulator with XRE-family HTH domain